MLFELIVNILLAAFLGYAYFTHVLEAAVPIKVRQNPYVLQPDVWPKAIIILLEICLILNIIRIIRRGRGREDFTLRAFAGSVPGFLKSRQFRGMAILLGASLILDTLGFLVTSTLILLLYGMLLGERHMLRLILASAGITLALYVVFSGMLSVNLPRGTVGFLRNFALFLESAVEGVKGIFG